ncbi:MAG: TdeIII family type II restriction endonuclease [Chloroflexi bacterium]|nr:TdeIII family type II restriction endonuclease [Chloroflexota bacterium]
MKASTHSKVATVLRDFAVGQLPKLTKWSVADIRRAYPFHRLFFPDEAILAARVERSVVTVMGASLYPQLATTIALDKHRDVHANYSIAGTLNDAACNMIEQIVTELRTPPRRRTTPRTPDHAAEVRDILGSHGGGSTTRTVTADLFVGDFAGGPLFIELKTPLPNLDIAAESKRKMLYFLAIMERQGVPNARAYLGLTYNPFLTRAAYGHSFTRQIMDMDAQVLLGQELWDHIGGDGTYDELLAIIEEVKDSLPHF